MLDFIKQGYEGREMKTIETRKPSLFGLALSLGKVPAKVLFTHTQINSVQVA